MERPYQKYVYSQEDRQFRGDFELMYSREDEEGFDSWFQEDVTHVIRQLSLALLSRFNFERVVDIGCGKGTFTHLLKKTNNSVKGLDISPTAITKARVKYPHIEFEVFDVTDLAAFDDEPVDLVVAMALLYYVEDWRTVLQTLAGMTTYLFVTLYIPEGTLGFISTLDEFLTEAAGHFETETELVLNKDRLLYFGRARR